MIQRNCRVTLADDGRVIAYENTEGVLIDASTGKQYVQRKSWNVNGPGSLVSRARVSHELLAELQHIEYRSSMGSGSDGDSSSDDVQFFEGQIGSLIEEPDDGDDEHDEEMDELLRVEADTETDTDKRKDAAVAGEAEEDHLAPSESSSMSIQIFDAYFSDLVDDSSEAAEVEAQPTTNAFDGASEQELVDILCSECGVCHDPDGSVTVDLCSGCDKLFCDKCSGFATTRAGQKQLVCLKMCQFKLMDMSAAVADTQTAKKATKLKAGMLKISPRPRRESEGGISKFRRDLLSKSLRKRSGSQSVVSSSWQELLMSDKANEFTRYLKAQGCSHQATFYRMISRLKLVENELDRLLIGAKIYHLFIKEDGESYIDIMSPEVRRYLETHFTVGEDVFNGAHAIVRSSLMEHWAQFTSGEGAPQQIPVNSTKSRTNWRKRTMTRKNSVSVLNGDLESSLSESSKPQVKK